MVELLFLIALVLLILLFAITGKKWVEFNQGWRVRKIDDTEQQYSELIEGHWKSIKFKTLPPEKANSRTILVIPNDWSGFPVWARKRKKAILKRIHRAFSILAYELVSE